MNGEVKFFNRKKGYGFIKADDEKEYFVHFSDVANKSYLQDGQKVTFDIGEGKDGNPKATNVKPE